MCLLGAAITESILQDYGYQGLLSRLSNPCWFQALGCVMGMDWHSSGITTSVMGALKKAIQPRAEEWGLYVCGGRGRHSRQTPDELYRMAEKTGLDGDELARSSRLTAKVDNAAIQDGFQLYLHSFLVTREGQWAVIQQGMNTVTRQARRYHWLSAEVRSFVEEPHTGVCGQYQGPMLNLTHRQAAPARDAMLNLAKEASVDLLTDAYTHLSMPSDHQVRSSDVNLKRLGAALAVAHEVRPDDFASLLLLPGVGPRTLQALALVSEVIHGTPSRFDDPARFSFAHGGKDGHPFPVPLTVYDHTITEMQAIVEKARIGHTEKSLSLKKLHGMTRALEENFIPNNRFDDLVRHEREQSHRYGGRTVKGPAKPPPDLQLSLF